MQASSLKLSCIFRWRLGPDWVLATKMYGKTEILSDTQNFSFPIHFTVRSQKLDMLSSSNFQLSLFLMSTKSYIKFRSIRGTPQKWVGFGKPLFPPGNKAIEYYSWRFLVLNSAVVVEHSKIIIWEFQIYTTADLIKLEVYFGHFYFLW